jgi:hypothetical protein
MSTFDESKHPRDAKGRFAKKSGRRQLVENAYRNVKKKRFKINLQFFTEKAILTQTNQQIIDGIESLKKAKEYHEYKMAHPWEFYKDWYQVPEIVQKGRLFTWQKEIRNHTNGINDRIAELKKRGVDYDAN